jgi:enoyl-CoA hydratase
MPEDDQRLRLSRPRRHVAVLEIDVPPRNVLDDALRRELIDVYARLTDDTSVRAIVLRGGSGTFSAGGDLREDQAALLGDADPTEVFASAITLMRAIEGCPHPTVAALEGPAFGAGLEMACACDLRVCSPGASFCASGVKVGLVAGQFRLPRLIGLGRAKEMLLTGAVYGARWAEVAGLVNVVTDDPSGRAIELASAISSRAPRSVRMAKLLAQASYAKSLEQLDAEHVAATLELFATRDHAEAVRAFLQREDPTFTDR